MIHTTFHLPKIYPLTDVLTSGLSHAEQVSRCAEARATLVQLREKLLPAATFFEQARDAVKVAREKQVTIIINDRVDIALAVHADGVHLGQEDLPPAAARKLLGNSALIGYSTHSVEQARQALSYPIDYIAIGPIFGTTTKENPDPQVGLEGLRAVKAVVGDLPLVAIGGISVTEVAEVLEAGADSVALISGLWRQPKDGATLLTNLFAANPSSRPE